MNRLSIQKYLCILGVVISSLFITACRQESHWERTLAGPFHGDTFKGEVKTQAASSLPLSANLVLATHWGEGTTDPVLCLHKANGTAVWARVLTPRLQGEDQPRGAITSLELTEVKRTGDRFKVMLLCDWTAGGKERGIIYLSTNYNFQSFSLGW
jgi:hypothetical protein